ncbi:hypothetical protein BC332_15674 [Capsicum chinense]|nr:hypothetical protein BC332_15674 [Capsicum chinense]
MDGSYENYPGVMRPSNLQETKPMLLTRSLMFQFIIQSQGLTVVLSCMILSRHLAVEFIKLELKIELCLDEEIEMEDAEDWSVVNIDSSDKKNELGVMEYIDDIYAY